MANLLVIAYLLRGDQDNAAEHIVKCYAAGFARGMYFDECVTSQASWTYRLSTKVDRQVKDRLSGQSLSSDPANHWFV